MGKVRTLLIVILLALASATGYLILTEKITTGERRIAESEIKLEKGQHKLEDGKAKLEAGKRELADGKKEYKQAKDNLFLVLVDKLLKGGKGLKEAEKRIADGDTQIAKGEDKVKVEESRLAAGELKQRQGKELLRLAKDARVACAVAAVFFASLSIVLGVRWRRSLTRFFMHADA